MRDSLGLIRNKWKQYINRIFLSDTSNNLIWYESLIAYLLNLNIVLERKLKHENPVIVIVSSNILVKVVIFIYCFTTSANLILISPKFGISAIVNAMLAKRANVLIIDKDIEHEITRYEQDEGINVLKYFKCIETTSKLLESMTGPIPISMKGKHNINRLYKKGLAVILAFTGENNLLKQIYKMDIDEVSLPKLTVLSPGTTAESSFVNIPYKVLCKSMQAMSYFLGLKPEDKVGVITDFEFFSNVFTLLGFLNGIRFVYPDIDITSAEGFMAGFKGSDIKPNVVIIDSYHFKTIWDSILMKVYSSRLMLKLSKFRLLAFIPEYMVLHEIKKLFGKGTKVHILNEELGLYCLGILKRSKILFTSSYGYLEQGNFLAFKDPVLFKSKKFYSKPGGTVLKDNPELFDSIRVEKWDDPVYLENTDDEVLGEITVKTTIADKDWIMRSEDLALEVPNVTSQGSRKFLYLFGRKSRYPIPFVNISLELIEKSMKDTLLIRDCLMIKHGEDFFLYIEPREEIFDLHRIEWSELEAVVMSLINELKKDGLKVKKYAILSFNGLRNVAGKIELYYNT